MPVSSGPRLNLQSPQGTEQILAGDDAIRAIAAVLEAKTTIYETGTGALPAAGTVGRIRFQSDVGVTYFDTGTKWRVLGGHTGQLSFTARTTAPTGFLICTGQAVTTTFPELRDMLIAMGNPYGSLSGNPLLPPAPGRALVAAGSGTGLTPRTNGATFGAETHKLTPAQVPSYGNLLNVTTGGSGPTAAAQGAFDNAAVHPIVQPSVALNLLVQT